MRASLCAVALALTSLPRDRSLVISYDNAALYKALLTGPGPQSERGWSGVNSDVVQYIITLARTRYFVRSRCNSVDHASLRTCPAQLKFVSADSRNPHMTGCHTLARSLRSPPRMPAWMRAPPFSVTEDDLVVPPLGKAKLFGHPPRCSTSSSPESLSSTPARVNTDLPLLIAEPDMSLWTLRERSRFLLAQEHARAREALLEQIRGSHPYWKILRSVMDPSRNREPPPAVTLTSTLEIMSARINILPSLPPTFDSLRYASCTAAALALPPVSIDYTPAKMFSANFTLDEIAAVKSALEWKTHSASGPDEVSYKEVMGMENWKLEKLFNQCISDCAIPTYWGVTQIVGVPKPGADASDPNNYRHISLESCALKFLSTLITRRVELWASGNNILPSFQNGFRANARTLDNLFVLRAAIERARAMGRTLFIAFLDLSNAFPSTHRPALWLKLFSLGMSGPIFDWIRMLYRDMEYFTSLGDETSDPFSSSRGILQGDPLSPLLFILFLSDLTLPPDPDNIHLGPDDTPVPLLAQADDILSLSLSCPGLQRRLLFLATWFGVHFLLVNAAKSYAMAFGPLPVPLPTLQINDVAIIWVRKAKYLGALLSSTETNIFLPTYTKQAEKTDFAGSRVGRLVKTMGGLPLVFESRVTRPLKNRNLTGT